MNESIQNHPPTSEQQAEWDQSRIQDSAKAHFMAIHGHGDRRTALFRRKQGYERNDPIYFEAAEHFDKKAEIAENEAGERYDPSKH